MVTGSSLRGGESKQESRTMREFAFGTNRSTVGEHDVFSDGEAEAGASGFARAGFVDAIEAFEQAREVLGSDAGAEILHEELDCMRNRAGAEDDSPAGTTVLQSVVDQVGEDLVNGFAVGEDQGKMLDRRTVAMRIGGRGILNLKIFNLNISNLKISNLKIDAVGAGEFVKTLFGIAKEFSGGNGLRIEASFAGFDAGEGEQILGKTRHAGGILADDFQKLASGRDVVRGAVEQGFGIALNRS